MYALLTQLLDIPNYHVVSAEIETDKITLDIESTFQIAACLHCRKTSKTLHERHPRMVRDLPISGKPTYLRFVRRRFFCDDCHRAFSESLIPFRLNNGAYDVLAISFIYSVDGASCPAYFARGQDFLFPLQARFLYLIHVINAQAF